MPRDLPSPPDATAAGDLSPDELFAADDDRFVAWLREQSHPGRLADLATVWAAALEDSEPADGELADGDPTDGEPTDGELAAIAERHVQRYFAQPLDRPGHRPLVKRLIKALEAADRAEPLADVLLALDRAVLRPHSGEDPRRRFLPLTGRPRAEHDPPRSSRLFSQHTRDYLRRRVWRGFRRLAARDPERSLAALTPILQRVEDEELQPSGRLFDRWALAHICFGQSESLQFTASRVRCRSSCGDLDAAPAFESHWAAPIATSHLVQLLAAARSPTLRRWAGRLLARHHVDPGDRLTTDHVLTLLTQLPGAATSEAPTWVERHRRLVPLDAIDAATWLAHLPTLHPDARPLVASLLEGRDDFATVPLQSLVAVACHSDASLAHRGLGWLDARAVDAREDRAALEQTAAARCEAIGHELADWTLSHIGIPLHYDRTVCRALLLSENAAIRAEAWDWLDEATSPGRDDVALWRSLLAARRSDLAARLVEGLERFRTPRPGRQPAASLGDVFDDRLATAEFVFEVEAAARIQRAALRQLRDDLTGRHLTGRHLAGSDLVGKNTREAVQRPDFAARTAAVLPLLRRAMQSPHVTVQTEALQLVAEVMAALSTARSLGSAESAESADLRKRWETALPGVTTSPPGATPPGATPPGATPTGVTPTGALPSH